MTKITIAKMPFPRHAGDWHDKPLRWQVDGPDAEIQQFSTKADATLYKRIRRQTPDFNTACNRFVREA